MISAASFRLDYPEFSNQALYPSSGVNYWIQVAALLLNTARWGSGSAQPVSPASTMYDVASELFVAHNVAVERLAQKAAQSGGTPGVSKGPVSSESVGSVSRGYATGDALEKDAGHWNLTTYGTRFMRLVNLFGAGPVQVGPCGAGPGGDWCNAVSPLAFVQAAGAISFTKNPAAGYEIELGGTAVTFVAGAPAGDQVQVQASLGATMLALLAFLEGSDDDNISACTYAIGTPAPPAVVLGITYKVVGPTGNEFTISTDVPGATASGPTLVGAFVPNTVLGVNPWVGPPPWPGQTMFG